MKIKFVFVLFCFTLLLFLLILVLLPLFMLGPSFSQSYWRTYWPIFLFWFFLFLGFSLFYFINRQLFLLLEKEDWPALALYLEDKVIKKGKYSSRLVRILATSYLVLSDTDGVVNLENKTAIAKPALVDKNVLIFGTARILGKDFSGAARFFEARKYTAKPKLREWVSWYLGFSLLLDYRLQGAADEFSFLARESKNTVVTALSSFFLYENMARVLSDKEAEFQEISFFGKNRALSVLPEERSWKKEISRISNEVHMALISRYIEETGHWLYS